MSASTQALRHRPAPPRRSRLRPSVREALWGFGFVGIWIVGLLVFTAGPMIASLVLSFTDFNMVRPEAVKFIGLENWTRLVSDPTIATSLIATLKFAVITIPLTMVASLGFAVLLNQPKLPAKGPLRALVYMPMMIPLVASTLVWMGFLNTDTGWLNGILRDLGLWGPDWINSTLWVYPALSIMGLWGIGNFMLINIAGLQSVPTELYDAAKIDGAGRWQSFRSVTIPMMSPVLLYNLVIVLIGTFQYFTQAYVMTNGKGDPDNATLFMNLVLYREGFVFNHMGYAAAVAWLLFVIVLVLTLVLFWFSRSRVYYAGGDR